MNHSFFFYSMPRVSSRRWLSGPTRSARVVLAVTRGNIGFPRLKLSGFSVACSLAVKPWTKYFPFKHIRAGTLGWYKVLKTYRKKNLHWTTKVGDETRSDALMCYFITRTRRLWVNKDLKLQTNGDMFKCKKRINSSSDCIRYSWRWRTGTTTTTEFKTPSSVKSNACFLRTLS